MVVVLHDQFFNVIDIYIKNQLKIKYLREMIWSHFTKEIDTFFTLRLKSVGNSIRSWVDKNDNPVVIEGSR